MSLIKRKTLKKAISTVTAITTVVWLSGVSMLAMPSMVAAAIADGALIKSNATNPDESPTLESLDVYIVKVVGAKKFKRLILNPTVFNSYGHLNWGDIQTVSQSVMDEYTTSSLVRVDTDPDEKVYAMAPDGDIGSKSWINLSAEDFLGVTGSDADSIYTINSTDGGNYNDVGDITATTELETYYADGTLPAAEVASGDLTINLSGASGDNSASKVAAMGAQDVVFTTAVLTASSAGAVKVDSIEIARGLIGDGGIAADGDFTALKLYRDSVSTENKLGSTLTLNTTTHTANFTNLNWTINAGETDKLVIVGSLKATGITGNVMMLGVRSASAVSLENSGAISGTFPLFGSKIIPATIAVGQFDLDVLDTPANAAPLSGTTDQHVATLQFESESEDFQLNSVKITQIGSATPDDISNITLKYGATVIATIDALASNNTGVFNIDAPGTENIIKSGTTRNFYVYVDIAGGITTSRTIDISVQQASDVTAVGQTSGGVVTLLSDVSGGGTAYSVDSGAAHVISQGSLSVALSPAYNPSAANYVKGTTDRKATALRFSASSSEAVRVTQVTLTETGTSGDSDVSAVKLATITDGGEIGDTIATGSLSSGSIQFGTNDINAYDTDYLFEVPKGGNADVYVLIDIPTGASALTVILSVAAATDVKADGVSSENDIPSNSITGTATGNTHTITANGTVTASSGSTTTATSYVKGAQDKEFSRFTFTADEGEDITVSALALLAVTNANAALTTANSPTDVRVYKESVEIDNLLDTVASPATGVANFSFNDVIAAGTVRTYIVTADIPTTTGATTMSIEINAEADVTATGNSSGATGTAVTAGTYSVEGNDMTVTQGQLGVIASSLPVYTNITEKSNNVEVARFVLSSGVDGETVRLSSLKITRKGTPGNSLSVDSADLTQITLYDVNGGDIASDGVKTKVVGSLTSNAATFSGLSIDIPTGEQRVVGIKVNIGDSARTTPYIVMGIENYYTDVSASGLDSSQTVYANQLVKGGVLATVYAVSAADDLNLTGNITNTTDELDEYSVPALSSAVVANGDIILIGSELMVVNDASNSTVYDNVTGNNRTGFAGTTAASQAVGLPIILAVGGNTVLEKDNNTTAYANGSGAITYTDTVAGTFSAGQLMAVYDPDVNLQEDDIRLITAITTTGLTLTTIDIFAGAVVTESTDNLDGVHVQLTNYGQAQAVQAVGALTLAVASGTPSVGQIVAEASDVEFSRVKLTSLYEPIDLTKVVFTKTGDSAVDNHIGGGADSDFASVYLENLTNSTWGPNGNGKSNTISVVGGKATFNFSDTDALVVDYEDVNGIEIAIKGNLNKTTTGVTSGDAPKFYIAALDATNLTAKGGSTGTSLGDTFTAGTPTPVTATNFNAQTILKGKLDIELNSGSLSGTSSRMIDQTILKLDLDSENTGSDATFRAGDVNEVTLLATDFTGGLGGDGIWAEVGSHGCTVDVSDVNYIGSSGKSILFTAAGADTAAGDGIKYTFAAGTDLSDYSGMAFWFRNSEADIDYEVTLTTATAGAYTIDASTMEADHWYLIDIPFSDATTPFTGLTGVTVFNVLQKAGDGTIADTDAFNLDKLYFYKDKIKVDLSSGDGLDGTETTQHGTSATLKDGSTTIATAYYSGAHSAIAGAELAAGNLTFFPTTQFTIPITGKTLDVVADTTKLITGTGTGKTLSMSIGLGSANSNGAVTDGSVFWWDELFNLSDNSLRWVDTDVSSVQSGTISY